MTHNPYLTFLFLEDNDTTSAKSTAQVLSLNLGYVFLLLNFSVTGLCNSLASCSVTLILFSYQKTYRPYLIMLFHIHHMYSFQQFHKLHLLKSYLQQFSQLHLYYHQKQDQLCLSVTQSNEANAEIETQAVIIKARRSKFSA